MVCDVAEHLASHDGRDWDRQMQLAQDQGYQRALLSGLALASDLLDAPIPPAISVKLSSRVVRHIKSMALDILATRDYRGASLGDFSWLRYNSLDRFADRLRYVALFFGLPRLKHVAMIRLPDRAYWAYVPIALVHDLILLPLWRLWRRAFGPSSAS